MSTAQKVLDVTLNIGGFCTIVGLLGTLYYTDTIYSKKQDMFGTMMLCSAGVVASALFAGNIVHILRSQ
jgi:hypothetical protein